MLKRLLLTAGLACWGSYSYSESIAPYYGQTGNAASNGYTWDMSTVLPSGIPGLDINTIIYNYTPIKNPEDAMKVHIQNQNALGNGYVFRETDDWSGVAGGIEIRKVVPVIPNIPRAAWGQGSIEVEGTGTVTNPNVIYSYKVDPCYDPQFSPMCPGYVQPKPLTYDLDLDSLYDVTKDSNVNLERKTEIQNEENLEENEKDKEEAEEEQKRKYRLEKAMSAIDASALFAETVRLQQITELSNMAMTRQGYYSASIPGGTYKESVVLVDTKLPENKRGLRNGFAQQLLHQKMIEMQYK